MYIEILYYIYNSNDKFYSNYILMRTREERRMLSRIKFVAKIKKIFNEYGKFQAETWDQFKNLKWAKLYKNTRTWQRKFAVEKLDAINEHKREKRNAEKELLKELEEYEINKL